VFIAFTSSYLAWELGFETWTRKDCVMPALAIMKNDLFLNDTRLLIQKTEKYFLICRMIKSTDYVFTKSVAHFKRVALTKTEYALLIAIIFTSSSKNFNS